MYETRLRLQLTQNFRRDRESWGLFLQDLDKNHLLMNKMIEFWLYYFLKLHIQIRTRPRRDWLKLKQTRRDRFETVWNFSSETRQPPKFCTRPRVSVLFVLGPRLLPISDLFLKTSMTFSMQNLPWTATSVRTTHRALQETPGGGATKQKHKKNQRLHFSKSQFRDVVRDWHILSLNIETESESKTERIWYDFLISGW